MGGVEEEDERSLWSLRIEAAAQAALDQRPLLRMELQLLQHARQQAQGSLGQASSSADAAREASAALKQEMIAKLSGIVGSLAGTDRQRLQQQVHPFATE